MYKFSIHGDTFGFIQPPAPQNKLNVFSFLSVYNIDGNIVCPRICLMMCLALCQWKFVVFKENRKFMTHKIFS